MFSVKKNILETVALVKAYGIDQVVLCPGSRNAPLIQTFTSDSFFKCHVIVDERNAAFYALGIIQQTLKPVVVCCTSGSALLNFAPAVSEAYYQKLPLIVVSGDRSQEWIGQMDGQTIPQPGAFGSLSKKTVQLPEVNNDTDLWYCNRLINEALIVSKSENAPVQINVPISEPLFDYSQKELPEVRKIEYQAPKRDLNLDSYITLWNSADRRIIIVGQQPRNAQLVKLLELLVERTGCIVICEQLSNCSSPLFIEKTDQILNLIGEDKKAELVPEVLITLGGHIVSKRLKHFLRQFRPKKHWLINDGNTVVDLFQSLTDILDIDSEIFFDKLLKGSVPATNSQSDYRHLWSDISKHIEEPIGLQFSDLSVVGNFIKQLPQNSYLHLANSSVIRNAQYFKLDNTVEVFCNRGTNGIESSLPSAIGFASTTDQPVYLAIGDLSFFYTVGALWDIEHIKNLRILLINNKGGGIFHSLPGLDKSTSLKQYVAAEHNSTAEKWVDAAEFKYLSATNESELNEVFSIFFSAEEDQSIVLEAFTDIEISKGVLKEYNNKLKNKI